MPMMDLFRKVISHPTLHRMQTRLLGQHKLDARLEPVAASTHIGRPPGLIVDVGGGSARSREMWPADWRYVSIDPDERMLEVDIVEDEVEIERLVGSADDIPFPDGSVDVVLMQCVSHHLDDEIWPNALSEISRILKPGGEFVFLDGVWSKRRVISRLFWRLDAGRHPRESTDLMRAIESRFEVVASEEFALVHHAILVTARPAA